mgnify:CR=1 FL=1
MKKFILPAIILTATPALAAVNCATLPSCSELGYTKSKTDCYKYTVCPFDTAKVACAEAPAVGDIKYSLRSSNHDGWILCNGNQYSQSSYSKLYAVIGTGFCSVRNGGCSSGYFAVPDYRGFFLRGVSYPSTTTSYSTYTGSWNYSTTSPQKQGIPDIYGYVNNIDDEMMNGYSGAFYTGSSSGYDATSDLSGGCKSLYFDASRYNSIYGASSHVTPVNTAVYAYMYAGRVDSSAASAATTAASCVKGNYLYTDGTCSSSYTSSKTVKGIVSSVSNSTSYTYVQYVRGGVSYSSSGTSASTTCTNSGEWLASYSDWKTLPTNIPTSQSVVRSVQSGKYYWSYTSTKYYCSSQTSCSSSSTAGSSSDSTGGAYYPYYYCYGYMYFAK